MLLELTYDPAWAAVRIVVDGGFWPSTVDTIRIERSSPSEGTIPVRGVESLLVVDGYWIGSDSEMRLGEQVTYTVHGFFEGASVASESASIVTPLAPEGTVWLKVPGQPDLAAQGRLHGVSDIATETRGSAYQVASGGAVAQWGGVDTLRLTIVLETWGRVERSRLRAALRDRVLLLQPGDDADFDQGWFFLHAVAEENTFQVDMDRIDVRRFALELTAVGIPAGVGVPASGVSWATVMEQHDTWEDLLAAVPTWFDLQKGA